MNYNDEIVGVLPLPLGTPMWLYHLASSVACVDRSEFLTRIEDFVALARSSDLPPDSVIVSDRPPAAPLSLSLHDSGGWGRVSIATVDGIGDPVSLGVDLSPSDCRLFACSLLSMARFLERSYPEHAA